MTVVREHLNIGCETYYMERTVDNMCCVLLLCLIRYVSSKLIAHSNKSHIRYVF